LLATGFNPLHLQPFLHAHLQRLLPARKVVVSTGLYDDLAGTLARIEPSTLDMSAIALEWPDLDRRLGFRHLGGWGPRDLVDIVASAEARLLAIRESLQMVSQDIPLAVSMPTLELPPMFHTPSIQLCEAEARLQRAVDDLALWASVRPNIRFGKVHGVPSEPAFDFKGEILAGLPYTISHASRLGQCLAQLLAPAQPMKGLITDLDETLWAGIVGEVGPEGVSWDLASKSQLHGLYQQVLRALAEQGVLIGVASKNEPETVERVFQRPDVLLPRECLYPIEAHWTPKPDSVARILDAWNVHPDSVVFVDDSASEIAEVKAAYPEMECVRFDAQNYEEVHTLLYRLRDSFAKQTITEEDGLRRASLRTGRAFGEDAQRLGASHEAFLRDAEARLLFDFAKATHPRSLELVNKTNQFNLNGIRYTENEWGRKLAAPHTFVMTASYTDKSAGAIPKRRSTGLLAAMTSL
jgi:FkbH-like protein